MNWYIVKKEGSQGELAVVGTDGFAPKNIITSTPSNSGEIIKNIDYITVTDSYYSGVVVSEISGVITYSSPVYISGELVNGSIYNFEYGSVAEYVSGNAFSFYNRYASFDEGKYWAKQPLIISGQIVSKQSELIRTVSNKRDSLLSQGTVTFSGDLYQTSEQNILNITSQMMLIDNGLASAGNLTNIAGDRVVFFKESFKSLGGMIAAHNNTVWNNYASHIRAIKSGEAYNNTYLSYLNSYDVTSGW